MTTVGARTWPDDWDERSRGLGCAMCANAAEVDNGYGVRILSTPTADAYLQRNGHQRGYAVVVWRGDRHVSEPTDLTDSEAISYWRVVLTVGRALKKHFAAARMNHETLGNAIPHLHTHIEARFIDDARPGKPLAGSSRFTIPEEQLDRDAAALSTALASSKQSA